MGGSTLGTLDAILVRRVKLNSAHFKISTVLAVHLFPLGKTESHWLQPRDFISKLFHGIGFPRPPRLSATFHIFSLRKATRPSGLERFCIIWFVIVGAKTGSTGTAIFATSATTTTASSTTRAEDAERVRETTTLGR